ncbi:proteasome subunit beta [Egibacter rhizosphaerae]|uniref:Proteasome subunit beta n=1 Tax=Egibacter rhizosphaerae TaxID=1670831 RepID=A0A411YLT5_9ACTN|nr:proteasome subunit beta [Egibacter rhizosphaerae]
MLERSAPDAHPRLDSLPEHVDGTTVLALTFGRDDERGVIVAGDRRATAGNVISKRDVRKVFQADEWSAVAISGAAGPAMELAKIFATELEHYEKVEGSPLSLEGKANKLAQMVRNNLPMAMQGLVVVPMFAGFDHGRTTGRIYEFDPTGGRYEERHFASTGSGGRDARGSLKARYREDLSRETAIDIAIEALWDAADEDIATGGPDVVRQIYPLVTVVDSDGYRELEDDTVAERVDAVINQRRRS